MWALCTLLQDIDRIFSNIIDIYEFSVTFLGLMEAAIEVADEGKQPAIGECFEEMAEVTLQFSIFLKESCPPVLFISFLPYLLLSIPSLPSCSLPPLGGRLLFVYCKMLPSVASSPNFALGRTRARDPRGERQ